MIRHILRLIYILQCLCIFGYSHQTLAESLPEYTIKTTYLYNFALLTEWPKEIQSNTFDICIFGQDNFGPALNSLRGKSINNKPIEIRHIQDTKEAMECHLVFIGNADRYRNTKLVSDLANLPVLTITDERGLSEHGAMIQLYPENQRLVFEINITAAKQAKLNLSSKLLKLARRVTSQ